MDPPSRPPWSPLLLLALLLLLPSGRAQEASVETCCSRGYEWASQKKDCRFLSSDRDSKECRIAQEQCCLSQLEVLHCTTGMAIASKQEYCDLPRENSTCEDKIIKKCCYCCFLGKEAQKQGHSCEQSLLMGYQCGLVFRACCVEGQENSDAGIVDGPNKELVEINLEDHYLNDRCRGGGPCTQQCRDTGTSVLCSCFMGYQLQPDGFTCEDINECITSANACNIGQICVNTLGSFRCQRETNCGTGYQLTEHNFCKDIDECETGIHNCLPDFICQNTPGSFRCRPKQQCKIGFIQDALGSCIDINECLTLAAPCPAGQACINTDGSFACHRNVPNCGRGYHLNEDKTRCVDIDECSGTSQPCGKGHTCINSPGSYRCQCQLGYYFDGISKTCTDVNECRRYPGRLCAHKCENTPGSYYCSCTMGFKLSSDGRSCEDLNECESSPCSQECANVYGSYQCYCRRGYQLSDIDGVTCEDIDECALPTGGHICAYRCINVAGSFQCTCPPSGYKLAPNARNCQDIDECLTETHTCSHNQTCFNIQGGFRCLSLECPENYRKSGDTRCERLPCPALTECQQLPLRITSYHLSFPTNLQAPLDIFRMGPSNVVSGDHLHFAILSGNEGGFFTVRKVDGYRGVVTLQRPIPEPQDLLLRIQMQVSRHGRKVAKGDPTIPGHSNSRKYEPVAKHLNFDHMIIGMLQRIRHEKTDTIRCIKSCRPSDANCILDPVHTISHTVISLPTFREFSRPEEIIFLRAITPAYATNEADIIFDITEGNLRDSFDIIKRYADGMTVGVVRQVKPIIGPFYATLKLEMNYVVGGVVSHRNVVNVHIFVSEYWF